MEGFYETLDAPLKVESAKGAAAMVVEDVRADAPKPPPVRLRPRALTLGDILSEVGGYYGVSVADLRGERRPKSIAHPRQIVCWLARDLTEKSYPLIGRELGARDHTTVLFAKNKLDRLRRQNPDLEKRLQFFRKRIITQHAARIREEAVSAKDEDLLSWNGLGKA